MWTAAAILILLLHLVWIVLLIFGALFTRRRPFWTTVHILALIWGIIAEAGPWSCPLTIAEQYFEVKAGTAAWQGSFLLHTLDATVYPNVDSWVVTVIGVVFCAFNLSIYLWRLRRYQVLRGTRFGR